MNDDYCERCEELRAEVVKRDTALRDWAETSMACPNPGLWPNEAFRLGWAYAIARVVQVIRGG